MKSNLWKTERDNSRFYVRAILNVEPGKAEGPERLERLEPEKFVKGKRIKCKELRSILGKTKTNVVGAAVGVDQVTVRRAQIVRSTETRTAAQHALAAITSVRF